MLALSKFDAKLFGNEYCLVECDALFTGTSLLPFRAITLPLCSGPINPEIIVTPA